MKTRKEKTEEFCKNAMFVIIIAVWITLILGVIFKHYWLFMCDFGQVLLIEYTPIILIISSACLFFNLLNK